MSGRISRYVSFFILGALFAAFALLILARLVITPERITTAFVPIVERYLHCDVNLESVDVSIFSGATLSNLELLNRADGAMILAADKVVLRYQLLPLLSQRVVVDEIRLVHPRINVERYPGGEFNLLELLRQKKSSGKRETLVNDPPDSTIDILVSHLYIQRGELLFKDYSFGSVPHRYKLTDFDLHIVDFSLENDFTFELWGKVNGAPLDAEGTLNVTQARYDFKLIADQLDMVQFQPYYRDELDGRIDGLNVSVNARFSSAGGTITSLGHLQLHQLDYASASVFDAIIRAQDVDVQYELSFDRQHQLVVDRFDLDYDGVQASAVGHLSFIKPTPDIDLHLTVSKWSLRKARAILPRSLATIFSRYDLAGDVAVDLLLRGKTFALSEIIQQSAITFDSVQASIGNLRPSISGTITTFGESLASHDLSVVLGDNNLQLNLTSDNLLSRRPTIKTDVVAQIFDLNTLSTRLHSEQSSTGAVASVGSLKLHAMTEPDPVSLPFNVVGALSIDTLRLRTIDLSVLKGQFSLRNNILKYDSLSCAVANGHLNSNGAVDLTQQGYTYSGHIAGRDLRLEQLQQLIDLNPRTSFLGKLDISVDYSGAGTQKIRVQQNLSGHGNFKVDKGTVSGASVMSMFATLFNLPEFNNFRFDHGQGTFNLNTGGPLRYDTQFESSDYRVYPVGTWRSNGAIAADVAVYLSPALATKIDSRSKVLPYLQLRDGWSYLPLLVTGSVDAPQVKIDIEKAGRPVLQRVGADLNRPGH